MLAVDGTLTPATVEIQVGADAATYGPATATTNAYEEITALVAWANDVARPWTGTRTFAWSWQHDTATGGALLTLSADGLFDVNLSTGCLYLPTMAAQTSTTAPTPATLTWCPKVPIAVARHTRLLGSGDLAGGLAGWAMRPGVPGLAGIRPTVSAVGKALDAARLTAILATATTPRLAWVYQTHTATWRRYALGPVSRSADGATDYRFSLEVAGEVV